MPSPFSCPQCGTRGVCPQCRARAQQAEVAKAWDGEVATVWGRAAAELVASTRNPVLSDHQGAENGVPTDSESSAVTPGDELERAIQLTASIANLEGLIEVERAARREALRQATEGPDGMPVAQVAKRLGLSRERVYKLLR